MSKITIDRKGRIRKNQVIDFILWYDTLKDSLKNMSRSKIQELYLNDAGVAVSNNFIAQTLKNEYLIKDNKVYRLYGLIDVGVDENSTSDEDEKDKDKEDKE